MKFCKACGGQLSLDARFCKGCGNPVTSGQPRQAQTHQPVGGDAPQNVVTNVSPQAAQQAAPLVADAKVAAKNTARKFNALSHKHQLAIAGGGVAVVILIIVLIVNLGGPSIVGTWEQSTTSNWRTHMTFNRNGTGTMHEINVNTGQTEGETAFRWSRAGDNRISVEVDSSWGIDESLLQYEINTNAAGERILALRDLRWGGTDTFRRLR